MKPLLKNFQMVLFGFSAFYTMKFRTFVKFDFGHRYTVLFINTRIPKFKSQLTFALLAAVNRLKGPLRKHKFTSTSSVLEQFYIFNYAAEGQHEPVMVCDL